MAAKPVNGRSWRKVTLLCVEAFSVKCGLGQQQNMGDLSSSGLGNSKQTTSPSYHTPWLVLSTGLCATWVWNWPSGTGLFSSHCAASAVMNSGSHPEHRMLQIDNSRHARHTGCHRLIIAGTQGRNVITWCPSHLMIWHHLLSSHQGTLTKEINVGRNCPE
jgi:hypothetical protein